MTLEKKLSVPLLVAPVLLAFARGGDQIAFHPAQGSTFTKTFNLMTEMTMDEMSLVLDGKEVSEGMELEMDSKTEMIVAVTDEYVTMAGGRATKLKRTFDQLASSTTGSASNPMTGTKDIDLEGESGLEGKTVIFSWGTDGYQIAFDESTPADGELLEGLEADMDLLELLPSNEIGRGDSYSIEPNALRGLFIPGGALKIEAAAGAADEMGTSGAPDEMLGEFEGKATGTFGGVHEEGGAQLATIKLVLDVSSNKDISEYVSEQMEKAPKPDGMDIEMDLDSSDIEHHFRGEGELVWNLTQGVLKSLELSGEVEDSVDTVMSIAVMGKTQNIENSVRLSGSQTVVVSVEAK
jgi:hypothetical protein